MDKVFKHPLSLLLFAMICFGVSVYIPFSIIAMPVTIDSLFRLTISFLLLGAGAFLMREIGTIGTAMQLNRLYLWKMTILSPYMTVKEEKELRAMWALMKKALQPQTSENLR